MAVDTPARIAILGAGPIGLEAALYARYLGYEVQLFERAEAAHHVRRWGHVTMFTPFEMNSSPLGRAALAAQDPDYQNPPLDAPLTGREWVEQYLRPLSESDLIVDSLQTGREVLAVGRRGLLKGQWIGRPERDEQPLRVLTRDSSGREFTDEAEIVIDTTGVFAQPNWLGPGGTPALGERPARGRIEYHLPDVLGEDRARYAGRHTLVVGNGYSAATTVVALSRLHQDDPATRVTWITRPHRDGDAAAPVCRLENDRLPLRDQLAAAANALAKSPPTGWQYRSETTVEAIELPATDDGPTDYNDVGNGATDNHDADSPLTVTIARHSDDQRQVEQLRVDNVVANVGYRPDVDLFRELQAATCYATEGPTRLAAELLGHASNDCLAAAVSGIETLIHPEPNFYVLGSKSYGRNSNFLFSTGLDQIRALFALIGDREDLDLYATAERLPR